MGINPDRGGPGSFLGASLMSWVVILKVRFTLTPDFSPGMVSGGEVVVVRGVNVSREDQQGPVVRIELQLILGSGVSEDKTSRVPKRNRGDDGEGVHLGVGVSVYHVGAFLVEIVQAVVDLDTRGYHVVLSEEPSDSFGDGLHGSILPFDSRYSTPCLPLGDEFLLPCLTQTTPYSIAGPGKPRAHLHEVVHDVCSIIDKIRNVQDFPIFRVKVPCKVHAGMWNGRVEYGMILYLQNIGYSLLLMTTHNFWFLFCCVLVSYYSLTYHVSSQD